MIEGVAITDLIGGKIHQVFTSEENAMKYWHKRFKLWDVRQEYFLTNDTLWKKGEPIQTLIPFIIDPEE